jgi:hypothetical protein
MRGYVSIMTDKSRKTAYAMVFISKTPAGMPKNLGVLQNQWNLGRFTVRASNQYAAREVYEQLCAAPQRTGRSGMVCLQSGECVHWVELAAGRPA